MQDHQTRHAARTEELCPDAAHHDILRGADQIALFLFGDKASRKKVYHLAEKTHLPVFRLGSVICARKSTLWKWIEDQEARALSTRG